MEDVDELLFPVPVDESGKVGLDVGLNLRNRIHPPCGKIRGNSHCYFRLSMSIFCLIHILDSI